MATPGAPISAFAAQRALREHAASLKTTAQTNGDEHSPIVQDVPVESHSNSPAADVDDGESDVKGSLLPEDAVLPGELLRSPSEYDPVAAEHITLHHDQYITILGSFEIEVLSGVLILSGTALHATSGRQNITTALNSSPALYCLIGPANITLYNSQRGQFRSLKLLSPLFSKSFGGLPTSHYSSGRTYAKVLLPTAAAEAKKSEDVFLVGLKLFAGQPGLRFATHRIPRAWMHEIRRRHEDHSESSRRILQVIGPPRAGTMTFSTMTINSFLAQRRDPGDLRSFALIDLNFQAPLVGPPGQLSLTVLKTAFFGPAFINPISTPEVKIFRAHAVGVDGYQENGEHFLACVKDLIQTFEYLQNATDLPPQQLLIHCPTSRAGSDFEKALRVRGLINEHARIADIDTVAIGVAADQYVQGFNDSQFVIRLLDPDRSSTKPPDVSSTQRQEMQLISYFHAFLNPIGLIKWDAKPVQHHLPYATSWDSSDQDFAGLFIISEVPDMYPGMLSALIAGSLVQIIVNHEHDLTKHKILRGEGDDIPYFSNNEKGYTDPLDPQSSECIGVALVRRIDIKRKLLWLVTPIPSSVLASLPRDRTVLAFGAFDTPVWAYAEKDQLRDETIYEMPFGLESGNTGIPPNVLRQLELRAVMDDQSIAPSSNDKQSFQAKTQDIRDDRIRRIMDTTTPRRFKP